MKKFLVLLLIILTLNPIMDISRCHATSEERTMATNTVKNKYYSKNLFYLSDLTPNTTQDFTFLNDFITIGGIVIDDISNHSLPLSKALNMRIEPEIINSNSKESHTCVATLYYRYSNELDGIYIINSASNITEEEKTYLINEAIAEIHTIQSSYESTNIQLLSSNEEATNIGNFTLATTCYPKGKIKANYMFFTAQNHNGKDYYTVKANIYGYPGATLASSNSNYKTKFKGLSLKNHFETPTTSVTIDSYGPHRTIKTTSYSVSVGTSFENMIPSGLDANFSYSKNIPDTTIEATSTTKKSQWEISLSDEARKQTINFVPATTFVCPDTKESITISASSDYTIDSWDTLKETISTNIQVRCTASNCTKIEDE